jgi:hypothetical protein
MRLTVRTLGVVLVLVGSVGLAACDSKPVTPPSPSSAQPSTPATETPADPVYAYATKSDLRVMRGPTELARVPTAEAVFAAEWAPDGSRFVAATSTQLISVDAKSGAVKKAACQCSTVALAAGKVFSGEQGERDVAVRDPSTLEQVDTVRLDHGLESLHGAGDRVVTFQIVATGARNQTDVVVLDPATGSRTKVGDAITAADFAYTPRGWGGGPTFAYVTTGSTGALSGVASVRWFDPTGTGQQVEIDDRPLRDRTPDVPEQQWNSGTDHLWWAADGTLHATAWTWKCTPSSDPLQPDTCEDQVPHTQWKFDGAKWTMVDERELESVRDIGGGARLEHQLRPDGGVAGSRLTLVDKGKGTDLAPDVVRVWTPPQPRPTQEPPPKTGSQELAQRFAPMVWLHPDEPDFPMSTAEFAHHSALWFEQPACNDREPIATDVDESKLGRGEYQYLEGVPASPRNHQCVHPQGGKVYRTDEVPEEGKGFYLDVDDDALHGTKPDSGHPEVTAPVYWQFVPGTDGHHSAYLYWFFYGNDTYTVGHEGDWERIAVQLTDGDPSGVTFWKHEAPPCVAGWTDVRTDVDHPVIFSAKGAHGSYPREGTYPRYDGTQWGTDYTGKGYEWNTGHEVLSVKDQPWYGYRGNWGKRGSLKLSSGKPGPFGERDVSAALTTNKCDVGLPLGFPGTWKTDQPVTDPVYQTPYRIRVELTEGQLGDTVGRVFYPGLGCDGTWVLGESTSDKAVLRETRRAGTNVRCVGTATVELTKTATGLHYSRVDDHRQNAVTADLSAE